MSYRNVAMACWTAAWVFFQELGCGSSVGELLLAFFFLAIVPVYKTEQSWKYAYLPVDFIFLHFPCYVRPQHFALQAY